MSGQAAINEVSEILASVLQSRPDLASVITTHTGAGVLYVRQRTRKPAPKSSKPVTMKDRKEQIRDMLYLKSFRHDSRNSRRANG